MIELKQIRRSFLLGLAGLGISQTLTQGRTAAQAAAPQGYVLGPDGGDHLVHIRNPGNIFSSGNLALRTQEVPVDAGIPIHRHFEYDKAQQFMVVQLRSAYYPYCEMPSAIGRVSAPKRTFLAPGVGARSRTRPVATRRECVAQHWPPVPPRGHCECRMEVFVSLRGFSTAQ